MNTPILRLLSTVKHYATKNSTPLNLNYVCNYGKKKCPKTIISQSAFLHKELPIRLAKRVVDLENLPYDLSKTTPMQNVYELYVKSFDKILTQPEPTTEEQSKQFTNIMENVKEDAKDIEFHISEAINLYKNENKNQKKFNTELQYIDNILDDFYTSRIGIRFLIGQHTSVQRESRSESSIGIIDSKCEPHKIIKSAASIVEEMVDNIYLQDLKFEFTFVEKDNEFLYIPAHLHYIILEILKNAGKATAEFNNCSKPIKIKTSVSKNDFIIKVSDRGGGFSREIMNTIFSFSYSTAGKNRNDRELQLAGYGHGLGLSRIYARYFGGDLIICTVEGIGTDVYIYLNRFGNKGENVADNKI